MIIKTLNLLLVTAVFMFHKAEKEHYYNWDSIPYSMGVHIYEGKTMNEAHYRAFSNLKEVSPAFFKIYVVQRFIAPNMNLQKILILCYRCTLLNQAIFP